MFGTKKDLTSIIAGKSEKILRNDAERNTLVDWYPVKYDKLPINDAIFYCQRENVRWDSSIRAIYRIGICSLIFALVLSILMLNIIFDNSTLGFITTFVFCISVVRWLFVQLNSINEDIRRLDKLNALFSDIEKDLDKILIIQSKIFTHRKECTMIPDWLYGITKNRQDKIMCVTADIETESRR